MAGVFINYRVKDLPMAAAAIHADLVKRFGPERVFRDCNSMQAGEHYPSTMRGELERADVLVSVIGPNWLELTDEAGTRLIDRPRDWVRWEIARAIERGIPIIPALLRDNPENAQCPRPDQLPADIRPLALNQAASISQRRFGPDMDLLAARLVELAPALVIADLFAAPPGPRQADNAPSTVLRAEYAVVPYAGRAEELADLRSWIADPAACSARLVVGPAGSGKTRLAQVLCAALTEQGWLAGLVDGRAPAEQIRHTSAIDRPLLVVLDDAETSPAQLRALAAALTERRAVRAAPARLLLLSRSAGAWLDELSGAGKPVADLFAPLVAGARLTLRRVADPDRWYAAARQAFAAELGRSDTAGAAADLSGCTSVGEIQAAALADLLDRPGAAAVAGRQPVDVPGRLLGHDRRHWRRRVRAAGGSGLRTEYLALTATVATLCRPESPEQAEALAQRLPALLGAAAGAAPDYLLWLRRLYPGPYPVNPVRPDLLGERLVAGTLAVQPSIAGTLAATCTDEQVAAALTTLGRALERHPRLAAAVTDLVRVDPQRLVPIGIGVAGRLGPHPDLFSRALGAALDAGATDATGDGHASGGDGGTLTLDRIFELMLRLQDAGGIVDPLRAALMRPLMQTFERTVEQLGQPYGGRPDSGPLQPLTQAVDQLKDFALNAMTGFLDPASGQFPTGPDGTPLVPPPLLELGRKLFALQREAERRERRD